MASFVSPDIHAMEACGCLFSAVISQLVFVCLIQFFSRLVCKINIFSSTWPCSGATHTNLRVVPQEHHLISDLLWPSTAYLYERQIFGIQITPGEGS